MSTPTPPTGTPYGFGPAPIRYDGAWMSTFVARLTRYLGGLSSPSIAQQQVLLQAPDGTTYAVTVDNAGNLSTAVVTRGGTPPPV